MLAALGRPADASSHFEVQYFDVATPADAPPGFDAILRKRIEGAHAQLTYKLRGNTPWPRQPSQAPWRCPLPKPYQSKEEVDVVFVGAETTGRAYSRSCSHSSPQLDIAMPAPLQARPNNCKSAMTRLEAGALKVEEWRLPDGSRLIEVSRLGRDTDRARDMFRDQVVKPLLALQAQALQRSKSALGGECN